MLVAFPPEPFRLARQVDGLDLLKLDGAFLDEVVEVAVSRAGYPGAIEIDLERAAMVLVGPRRRVADAFHAGRHPVGLLIEALGDIVAGRTAVLDGPVDGFLHIERGADPSDVVNRAIDVAGRIRHFRNFHHRLHAGRVAAPAYRRAQWEDHAIGGIAGGLGRVFIHAPDVAHELHIDT